MRPIYRMGVKLPSRCPILYLFNKYSYWIFQTCCIISIFSSSKCHLFHNATLFGFCITHILNTGCAKIKKKIRRQKVKSVFRHVRTCKAEESHRILSDDGRCCGQDSKQVSPKYNSESLWLKPAYVLLLLLLWCRCYVVFCQTLSANDANSCLSSQCTLCPSHCTLKLFTVFTFLQFHHSNTTLISAVLLMLPTLLDRSYFFVW